MKPQPKAKAKICNPSSTTALEATAPGDSIATPYFPKADEVAYRAYLNYQNHGAADGNDLTDWLRAEAELVAEHISSVR